LRPSVLLVSDDTRWLREVSRTLRTACDVRTAKAAAARIGSKHTDLVLLDPDQKPGKRLEALRSEAKGAQVPVIELPSQMAASRLARTLAHLAV
jgi:DNA-binding response OmpR family regulator